MWIWDRPPHWGLSPSFYEQFLGYLTPLGIYYMCQGFDMGPMVYTTYLFKGCTQRNKKKVIFSICFIYYFYLMSLPWIKVAVFVICLCFKMVSFRGQKGWATPRLVSFRGFTQNFQWASLPLSYRSSPRGWPSSLPLSRLVLIQLS